jgi:hypothetical protein
MFSTPVTQLKLELQMNFLPGKWRTHGWIYLQQKKQTYSIAKVKFPYD